MSKKNCGCTDPCNHPCVQPKALSPTAPCFLIDPCNDGCLEVIDPNCVMVMSNRFGVTATLAEYMAARDTTLDILVKDFNTNNLPADHIVRYAFIISKLPSTFIVTRDGTEVINLVYNDSGTLLADLQALDPSWALSGTMLTVGGTSDWGFTFN